MGRALELARRGLGLASPNPMVGAVVVDASGAIAGEGWHEGPGTPHAERVALTQAGTRAAGGTLYVTLEPCNHQGRTPPCAPAVVEAGITRVVASVADPNPSVAGGGFEILRAAGLEVLTGVEAEPGARLIEAFAKSATQGMPWVTLKIAMSLDGRVAAADGSSRWITGEEARADGHRLRSEHDAIIVGAGTVIADDPSLTVRLAGYGGRQPIRLMFDSAGRTPATAALFDGAAPTWIATTGRTPLETVEAWRAAGATVLAPGDATLDRDGRVPVGPILSALAANDPPIRSALLEGGPTLAWSAVRAGVVDRFVVYVAPKLIGGVGAPGALGGDGVGSILDAVPVEIESIDRIGRDIRIVARPRKER
jgi:diaminohydroxyphosphoribosylaminopyrimidine deaminase/5-amino-6-(5-phosphoribosylamino)uracil reductase